MEAKGRTVPEGIDLAIEHRARELYAYRVPRAKAERELANFEAALLLYVSFAAEQEGEDDPV